MLSAFVNSLSPCSISNRLNLIGGYSIVISENFLQIQLRVTGVSVRVRIHMIGSFMTLGPNNFLLLNHLFPAIPASSWPLLQSPQTGPKSFQKYHYQQTKPDGQNSLKSIGRIRQENNEFGRVRRGVPVVKVALMVFVTRL
jgi:hypothetical protein